MNFAPYVCLVCCLCLYNALLLVVVWIGHCGEGGIFDDVGSKTLVM